MAEQGSLEAWAEAFEQVADERGQVSFWLDAGAMQGRVSVDDVAQAAKRQADQDERLWLIGY